ncbi:uncharacterized protein MELLADRAFT_105391 [Melampsora larici-populina 98AG31]|uniref:Uncharacterized protein n=1 Tax=Melampsora larici-populina (strain 98AG31 / pathotype 3-4-7) TaxID=747676 RepID=F4RHZ5_MELLP|nr:uncharacterized protein MELLADRAFT_105391 [Melampsora larici-populina 98AG31]EGG08046.1 hypothetical protein MELLADRAFT_105391 [Melampsora larici-populina 98AG31]
MTNPTRNVNLYSKADLNALLGNSSGDWTRYLPPPSLERRVPSTKPICMTEDASKFHLNMAFNRDGPERDQNVRFTCGVGPKTLPPTVQGPKLIASDISDDADRSEWRQHWRKWAFPLRTDAPRGLTWGPYYVRPMASLKRSAEDVTLSKEPKRQRIFAILRSPREPLVIKLKINQNPSASIGKDSKIFQDQEPIPHSSGPVKRGRSGSSILADVGQRQPKRHCNTEVAPSPTRVVDGPRRRDMDGREIFTTSYQLANSSGLACDDSRKELVNVMLSPSKETPLIKSRIKLCISSQLKYAS